MLKSPSSGNIVGVKTHVKNANAFDVWLLGIAIVIGGQVFSWNVALLAGFWEGFLGMTLTGVGYLCLVLCLSEMASALPFSCGSYGFVRVCVGPFFGYMIGCCEALQNMAYVASSVIPFGEMLTIAFDAPIAYEPIYWTFFFITAIGINIAGGKTFWHFIRIIAVVSFIIQLIYVGGTAQYGDFNKYTNSSVKNYVFDGYKFMVYFPINSWYYIGVESLPLACNDCEKPQSQLPIGMVACIVTLLLTAVSIFFTTTTQFPGTEKVGEALLPLNYGFQRLFPMSDADVTWLAIPSTYATGFGFMFVYGRQMCSMARSGLFPSIFKLRTKFSNSPYAALIIGSVVSLIGVLSIYYTDETLLLDVFSICILASYTVYVFALLSYIIFKYRYSTLHREFTNPLGVPSAVIGICVFLTGLVSVLGYQDGHTLPIIVFSIYLVFCCSYYIFLGYKKQQLSEDEQKILFRAYVINVNAQNRNKKLHHHRASDYSVSVQQKTQSRIYPESNTTNSRANSRAIQTDLETRSDAITPEALNHSHDDLECADITAYNSPNPTHSGGTPPDHYSDPYIDGNCDRKIVPIPENKDGESSVHLQTNSLDQPIQTPSGRGKLTSSHSSVGRHAISESIKIVANELKILPFMDGLKRHQYEEFVIAEYITGEFEDED